MNMGTMALCDGARVDFTRLRQDRRQRLIAAVREAGLDALVLGRQSNYIWATGARMFWRTGANAFTPWCVIIAATGELHLLSNWDDGIPPEIDHDHLWGRFFNRDNVVGALRDIAGLTSAQRIGTDSLGPFTNGLLRDTAPDFELVDATGMLAALRSDKSVDELACITMALTLAEAALDALEEALRPGVSELDLLGVYAETLARLGVPTPASESAVFATPRLGPVRYRALATSRVINQGELVVLSPGALYAGYEGGVGRTRVAGASPKKADLALADRSHRALDALIDACRAGNSGADLYKAWESTGEPPAQIALAYGLGVGAESPMIGFGRSAGVTLAEGTVLSVQSWVAEEGTGGCFEREQIRVGSNGPEMMSRSER